MFGSVIAFVIALGLFVWAWAWNNHMRESTLTGWTCVIIATLGSVVLYASAPAIWAADTASALVNSAGRMLGAGNIAWFVMMLLCIIAFGMTVHDLWSEPEHNPRAITALVVAPIAAHGTLGSFHTFMEVIYGGLSLGTLEGIRQLGGG